MTRIKDILLSKEKNGFFNNYEEPKKVATKILNSFIKFYSEGKGFSLDGNNSDKIGIISNIMGLSTFLELFDMGANISKYSKIICNLIDNIFSSLHKNGALTFDAAPYIFNNDTVKLTNYTETIAKSVIMFSDLRNFLIEDSFSDEPQLKIDVNILNRKISLHKDLIEEVDEVLSNSISLLIKGCLVVKENDVFDYKINDKIIDRDFLNSKVKYRGWAFDVEPNKQDEYQTSIYFTYQATSAFINIYESFRDFFDEKFENKTDLITNLIADSKGDKIFKMNEKFFNKNFQILSDFRQVAVSSGRYIETKMLNNKVNIAFDFVNYDFKPVNLFDVMNMQRNNHLVNTLFILGIFVNAGLDDDYRFAGESGYFYNQLQYSINNIRKVYSLLEKTNNEDFVSSYKLLFNEECPLEKKTVIQEFRKSIQNFSVYDFVPLYCNIYSIVSNYLIQYPQKEMLDNMEMIMENRAFNDEWIWDKDSFNINNNLYYVFALENFYEYYNKFEVPLSANGVKYNLKAKKAEDEKNDKINEIVKLKDELSKSMQKYEEKKSMLDDEVYKIAEKMYYKKIDESISAYMKSMLAESLKFALDYKSDPMFLSKPNMFQGYEKTELLFKLIALNQIPKIINECGDIQSSSDNNYILNFLNKKLNMEIINNLSKIK